MIGVVFDDDTLVHINAVVFVRILAVIGVVGVGVVTGDKKTGRDLLPVGEGIHSQGGNDSFQNIGHPLYLRYLNGKEVFDITKLANLTRRLNVKIAILTVPKESAKGIAQYLAGAGIEYIWNFTPSVLDVPKNVKVWNENLIGSFLQFTNNDDV